MFQHQNELPRTHLPKSKKWEKCGGSPQYPAVFFSSFSLDLDVVDTWESIDWFFLFSYDMPLSTGRSGRINRLLYLSSSFMEDCLPWKVILSFSSMTCRMDGWMAVASVFRVLERQSNTHLVDVHIR
jgi:hypothetical protein